MFKLIAVIFYKNSKQTRYTTRSAGLRKKVVFICPARTIRLYRLYNIILKIFQRSDQKNNSRNSRFYRAKLVYLYKGVFVFYLNFTRFGKTIATTKMLLKEKIQPL